MRLEARIRQQEEDQGEAELTIENQRRQISEMFELAKFRTKLLINSDRPEAPRMTEEVLDRMSLRQHEYIYTSFWGASNDAGMRQAARGAEAKAREPASTPAT